MAKTGFNSNSTLITSANKIDMIANGESDTYIGTKGADAFVIADGNVGDDAIVGFSVNDTIITHKKIFDGNGDGYIDFGPNAVLDVDRTSSRNAGEDQISVAGNGNDRVLTIRYLGTKDNADYAYGAAEVRDNLLGHFTKGSSNAFGSTGGELAGFEKKFDSQVGNETFDFSGSKGSVLLIDNATGLNFGSDTINNFGNDDLLVTTSKLYDSNDSKIVTFGSNRVLDLSGSTGPQASDPNSGPGGQVDTDQGGTHEAVGFLGQQTIGGTTYYYYGATTYSSAGGYKSAYTGQALHFDTI